MTDRETTSVASPRRVGPRAAEDWPFPLLVHLAAAATLVLVPLLWASRVAWSPRGPATLFVLLFAVAYLAAALPIALVRRPSEPGLARTFLCGIAAFGCSFILFELAKWRLPGIAGSGVTANVAFTALPMGMLLLLVLTAIRGSYAWKLVVLVTIALAAAWGHAEFRTRGKNVPSRVVSYVDTSLYVLKNTTYRRKISDGNTRGGAITPFAGGFLLAGGDGWLYFVAEDGEGGALRVDKLGYRVPFNPDEFREGGRRAFGDAWLDNSMDKLRVADLLVQSRPAGVMRVFASHHFWKADEACTVVRISVLEGTPQELLDPSGPLAWRTLYETTPCLALNTEGQRGLRFGGLQIGGALGLPAEDELLLTVGDHEFDGFKRAETLPQDASNAYGKVMKIRLDTGQAEMFTLGHRNPQGLYIAPDGTTWVLEHGPRGGDELNRLRPGANYGWPLVTYGTDYRLHDWPLSPTPGRHGGFEIPAFAFVPSIGVSQLTGVNGPLFDRWKGDLLAGSFFGGLVRIRIEDDRVTFAEPIKVAGRIRDVAEGPDGRILVWTDENDLTFLEPAASDSAETLLTQCVVCHTLSEREIVAIAPGIRGIVGRRVGSAAGYQYSDAILAFGGRWTEERLDRFLENPGAAVPGTTMAFEGVKDARERRQIIELLSVQVEEQQRPR